MSITGNVMIIKWNLKAAGSIDIYQIELKSGCVRRDRIWPETSVRKKRAVSFGEDEIG